MNKLEKYFLENLLKKMEDPFEIARAHILFRIILFFIVVLFFIPIITDIEFHYYKALHVHIVSLILLFTVPFIIKKQNDINKSLNYTFFLFFLIQLFLNMCINPDHYTLTTISWHFLFITMGMLLLRGKQRLFFTGFLFWLIPIYILLNKLLNGSLTIDFIAEVNHHELPVFVSFIPTVAIIYILFVYSSIIDKTKTIIHTQKKELEYKNQEITDSIVYSKRIQEAIIPRLEDIKLKLPNSFIFYKPKDIVSGDFYFFDTENNSNYIAVADCTGHGIPGAFMSLIGSKELLIARAKSTSPKEILFNLNNQLKSTLNQNQIHGTNDGMDIALIKLEGNQLCYAGANRPLWLIRENATIIEEYKASKASIGGYTSNNFEFIEHVMTLNKGDVVYLFSDGFCDQFGGQKFGGKKLTTKRFKEFLLSIKNQSIKNQEKELSAFFNLWKGGYEQTDDVLLIGIKI